MLELILLLCLFLVSFILLFINNKYKDKTFTFLNKKLSITNFIYRFISVITFVLTFFILLKGEDIMSYYYNGENIVRRYTGYLYAISKNKINLFVILKWFTNLTIAALIVDSFFENIGSRAFVSIFGSTTSILNFIFIKLNFYTFFGTYNPTGIYLYIYITVLFLIGCYSLLRLLEYIFNINKLSFKKEILSSLLWIAIYAIAFMPTYYPAQIFGYVADKTDGFNLTHRILIYICFIYMFISYFIMRNKSYSSRKYFLVMLSLSGFIEFFSFISFRSSINALPFHLCNTAIVLMFITYVFNIESIFYFTYLVNVLGAFFAVFLPSTGTQSLFNMDCMTYWYNHTYAATLPVLGVALGVFKKPNFKMVGKAIFAFSIYIVFAALLDGYLNNSPSLNPTNIEVDYFFLYSDFFIEKFSWALHIKDVFIDIPFLDGKIRLYPHLQGAVYVIFIILMYVIWGIYAVLFMVSDRHKELLRRKQLHNVDNLELLKSLNGRSVKEPLNIEGINMIKIENFGKQYSGSIKKSVENVNLEIHAGEVFGFIGHNGAGKSTTIKSLVGIQTITEGKIEIEGYDISKQPLEAKLNIGYVSDNHAVYEKLTGREYVSYVADLYMVSERDKNERLEKYSKIFCIEDALDREIKSYSHGMKQKIMVISALIHNPKVWVLDEPLTGLDPTSAYQIKQCMREHANNGNIVFFSSHVIEVVEKICDRIAIISHGKIRKVASIDELKKDGLSLEELYLSYQSLTD